MRKSIKEEKIIPVINLVTRLKSKILNAKWLPPVLAVSVIFVPNSLLLIKLLAIILALFLFYHSIDLDKNSSNRKLLK
jgi:hypothetical protein